MKKSPEQLYSSRFFNGIYPTSFEAAKYILSILDDMLPMNSPRVIDVGCGPCAWLDAVSYLWGGDTTTVGVDGPWLDYTEHSYKHTVLPVDLTLGVWKPMEHPEFDLAICLEVAEHLSRKHANNLVTTLAGLSDIVLFSAAVPGQGGVDHINLEWPETWALRFHKNGFKAIDCIRPAIWGNRTIPWWYIQNTILYVRYEREEEVLASLAEWAGEGGPLIWKNINGPRPLSLVHPRSVE